MNRFPTADQIVTALAVAAELGGEATETVNMQAFLIETIHGRPRVRARHYAIHALVTLFPGADKVALARCLGGKDDFYAMSKTEVFRVMVGGPRRGKRLASWWSEPTYKHVINTVSKVTT